MKHFLLLLFTFITAYSFGQNYQVFNDSELGYYKYQISDNSSSSYHYYSLDSNNIYFSASADSSVTQGNDKIIYHRNVVRGTGTINFNSTCLLVRDSSLFGNQTIEKSNGDYLFFTINNDTLLVQSQASIGTTWQLGKLENNTLTVEANVLNIQSKSIFNVVDNVKTISLTVKDNLGNTVLHSLNSQTIELSENYGILKSPNFLYFETDSMGLEMVGHSALNGEFRDIKWADIYGFEVGDVFHTLYRRTPAENYETNIYRSRTVTTKQIINDSMVYLMNVKRVEIINDDGVIDTMSTIYNKTEKYPLVHPSDSVRPQTSYWFTATFLSAGDYALAHYRYGFYNMDTEYMNGKVVKSAVNNFSIYNRQDSCMPSFFLDSYDEKEYIEGAGGPYDAGWGFSPSSYRLKYYKKGSETWGTPYNFDLLSNTKEVISAIQPIQITPNPATHQATIQMEEAMRDGYLTVFDMTGKVIYEASLTNENAVDLSVRDWMSGVYLVRIVGDERVWSGKLVKK
jgi:hypothetical protein